MRLGRYTSAIARERLTADDLLMIEEAEPIDAVLTVWYSFSREQRFSARVIAVDHVGGGPLAEVRGYQKPREAAAAAISIAQRRLHDEKVPA